ncbi:unnamed protein product [Kuraishia capsulata CBS 1993]|uniref:Vacuolar membrane protease n=1 Tax=Kuraishia capsulata CBS 1993 TaxID=1382522 RepID=W6MWE9_9ASCO|nr:uncharacterized protein KUCA_T00003303001 [Kuraishia capsulata CBS 1993]CDK27325.1 unnamed protein product [Kuraishia capsulata CBS 1993]
MTAETDPLVGQDSFQVRIVRRQRRHYDRSRCFRFLLISLFGMSLLAIPATLVPRYVHQKFLAVTKWHSLEDVTNAFQETLFSENHAGEFLRRYTNESHLAGDGPELVQFTFDKFEEYGLKASVNDYEVYLNTPLDHSLKMFDTITGQTLHKPMLEEDILAEDPTSTHLDAIPVFHGYSASGNVTAGFVYANFGSKADLAKLVELGVETKGKIAIVRNGGGYRGLKVKFAEDLGFVGMLMYPDPAQDHGITEENGYLAYPNGPARNPSSVERGSLKSSNLAPGDPTTPGYPSKPGCKRREPKGIPTIPTLPISYREVKPILESLNGHGLKIPGFGGAIPDVEYFTGPNPNLQLNLYNLQNYTIKPIHNVIGKLDGWLQDEVIVIGNHRDSWIKGGAGDPNSGSAVLLETIRAIAGIKSKYPNWKPLRSLVFISWDGEEYGLLGSSEFGEEFSHEISGKVVAYFNTDVGVSGSQLGLAASPMLNELLLESAKLVDYPMLPNTTLYEHLINTTNAEIEVLGSGSDFTVFLEHLGIPSLDIGFDSGKNDAVYHYHSNYDSYHWMHTFVDPNFELHRALAAYLGHLVLGMSENEVIRFNVLEYARAIASYYESTIKDVPLEWTNKNSEYKRGHHTHRLHKLIGIMSGHIHAMVGLSEGYQYHLAELREQYQTSTAFQKFKLLIKIKLANENLKHLEKQFLGPGLKDRPWFRHVVFASGRYDGYSGQNLPGLRESLEDDDIVRFLGELEILNHSIVKFNKLLKLR